VRKRVRKGKGLSPGTIQNIKRVREANQKEFPLLSAYAKEKNLNLISLVSEFKKTNLITQEEFIEQKKKYNS